MKNLTQIILIKQDYIPAIQTLSTFYYDEYSQFEEIVLRESRKLFPIDLPCQSHCCFDCKKMDNCEGDIYDKKVSFENVIYHYLSSCLQSIVSLWENQLSDFFLLEKYATYNEAKNKLQEAPYSYDLDKDICIREIRAVYGVLKHNEFGHSAQYLKDINSKYLIATLQMPFGEIRGITLRNRQLNIIKDDIIYFSNIFIEFWQKIACKINAI